MSYIIRGKSEHDERHDAWLSRTPGYDDTIYASANHTRAMTFDTVAAAAEVAATYAAGYGGEWDVVDKRDHRKPFPLPTDESRVAQFLAEMTIEQWAEDEDYVFEEGRWRSPDGDVVSVPEIVRALVAVLDAEDYDVLVCPACGTNGDNLQAIDRPERYWNGAEVRGGKLSFDGHFETTDDGADDHVACIVCGAEWALPEGGVDYR